MKEIFRRLVPKRVWEYMRQGEIIRRIDRFEQRTVRHRYGDSELEVVIADGLGEGWYDHNWPCLEEIELLANGRLKKDAIVFDLGSHQGIVAMMLAKKVGENGKVIALEGMSHNCQVAQQNFKINKLLNIESVHAVIADKPGNVKFFDGLNGSVARHGIGKWVEAVTIDQLTDRFGAPGVVFLDVEGYELKALVGAGRTLQTSCDWYVEVHVDCGLEEYGGSAKRIMDFFPPEKFDRYVWKLDSEEKPKAYLDGDSVVMSRFALVALRI